MQNIEYVQRAEPGIGKVIRYCRSTQRLEFLDSPEPPPAGSRLCDPDGAPGPGHLAAPLKLFISCTRRCDLDCPMCFAKDPSYQQSPVSAEDVHSVLSQAGEMGILEVRLTGGEPTVHPHFFEFVDHIVDLGINTSMNTHGAYSRRLLKKVAACPIDDVRVSIDGPEVVHDSLRGKGTFRRAVRTVRRLKGTGKKVRINTIVFRANVDKLEPMVSLARDLGVVIRFCPMRAIGRAAEPSFAGENVISPTEWRAVESRLAERGLLDQGVICFSGDEVEDLSLCSGMQAGLEECLCAPYLTQMGIDPEGEAYAGGCIDDVDKKFSVGSVQKLPLRTLWYRATQNVVRRILPRFSNCAGCSPKRMWQVWTEQLMGPENESRHLY